MAAPRRIWAYPLAALASSCLVASLWLPWYSFTFPAAALNRAESLSSQFGVLGPMIRQGAQELRQLGTIHLTAWQALSQLQVGLVLLGAAGAALALLVLTDRASGVARVIAWAGGIGIVLAGYRTLFPPGPSGALHPAWGAYFAVCCAAMMLVAGLVAHTAESDEVQWSGAGLPAPAPEPDMSWSTAGSVAPPGT